MPTDETIVIYTAIANTTTEMLSAAQQNEWERFSELESRFPDFMRCLKNDPSGPLSDEARDQIIRLIHTALDNHRAIEELVVSHMAQLSESISSVRTQRMLSGAYSQPLIDRE